MKTLKNIIGLTAMSLALVLAPVSLDAYAEDCDNKVVSTELVAIASSSSSSITSESWLPSLIGAVAAGGSSALACVLYHKKVTTGLNVKTEGLVWDKSGVEIISAEHVKTYKTVDKDAYGKK